MPPPSRAGPGDRAGSATPPSASIVTKEDQREKAVSGSTPRQARSPTPGPARSRAAPAGLAAGPVPALPRPSRGTAPPEPPAAKACSSRPRARFTTSAAPSTAELAGPAARPPLGEAAPSERRGLCSRGAVTCAIPEPSPGAPGAPEALPLFSEAWAATGERVSSWPWSLRSTIPGEASRAAGEGRGAPMQRAALAALAWSSAPGP